MNAETQLALSQSFVSWPHCSPLHSPSLLRDLLSSSWTGWGSLREVSTHVKTRPGSSRHSTEFKVKSYSTNNNKFDLTSLRRLVLDYCEEMCTHPLETSRHRSKKKTTIYWNLNSSEDLEGMIMFKSFHDVDLARYIWVTTRKKESIVLLTTGWILRIRLIATFVPCQLPSNTAPKPPFPNSLSQHQT